MTCSNVRVTVGMKDNNVTTVRGTVSFLGKVLSCRGSLNGASVEGLLLGNNSLRMLRFGARSVGGIRGVTGGCKVLCSMLPSYGEGSKLDRIVFRARTIPHMGVVVRGLGFNGVTAFSSCLGGKSRGSLNGLVSFLGGRRKGRGDRAVRKSGVGSTVSKLVRGIKVFTVRGGTVDISRIGRGFDVGNRRTRDIVERLRAVNILNDGGRSNARAIVVSGSTFVGHIENCRSLTREVETITTSGGTGLSSIAVDGGLVVRRGSRTIGAEIPNA